MNRGGTIPNVAHTGDGSSAPPPRPDLAGTRPQDRVVPALPDPTWKPIDILPVLLMPIGAASVLLEFAVQVTRLRGALINTVSELVFELFLAGSVLVWLRWIRPGPIEALGIRSTRPAGDLFLGILIGLGMLVVAVVVSELVQQVVSLVIGHEPRLPQRVPASIRGPWLIPLFFTLVLIGPAAEEILFRGFVFRGVRQRFAFWPAALISAACFSLAHVTFLSLPYTFTDGLILAGVFERRRSLVASFAAHATNNLVVFLLLVGARH
ncbi:MAG TPA: type II CAAX endopeptidase family protein [Actinomycetota bacterium]|jgi:membrane protease YdiL (CAAX protease family)